MKPKALSETSNSSAHSHSHSSLARSHADEASFDLALSSKSLDFRGMVSLRLTRPPEGMKPKAFVSSAVVEPEVMESSVHPTSVSAKSVDFRGMIADEGEDDAHGYQSMLQHFINHEGMLMTDVDLKAYELDAQRVVSNITVQELCKIHPGLRVLRLGDCNISDASLWSVGKYLPNIEGIVLSRCLQISNIGLRSFSLRCSGLKLIDLSGCTQLDDIGIMSIASGCWNLEHITLTECTGISDDGLGHIITCRHLRHLDLSGCSNIGDFGSKVLRDLGKFCSELRFLSIVGCKRVEDEGLVAVSKGCPHLQMLAASGGEFVTVKGLRAVLKRLLSLTKLVLQGCSSLHDKDVATALRARTNAFSNHRDRALAMLPVGSRQLKNARESFTDTLIVLDLSGASCMSDRAISEIGKSCLSSSLHCLNISASAISDTASQHIANGLTRLRTLDLSSCNITDAAIHSITGGVTAISTLKINNNSRITAAALISHIGLGLPFAELATQWVGYQPKLDFLDAIQRAELHQLRNDKALVIQKAMRRKLAYIICRKRRLAWTVCMYLPLGQALVRGHIQRNKYRLILLERRRLALVVRLQSRFRAFVCKKKMDLAMKRRRYCEHLEKRARLLQRFYRGEWGRKIAREKRDNLANKRLEEAKVQARKEIKATVIQRSVRARFGRNLAYVLIEQREKHRLQLLRRQAASLEIQRVFRGRLGRKIAKQILKQIHHWRVQFYAGIELQRVFRNYLARKRVQAVRIERQRKLVHAACIVVQKVYRGVVGYRIGKAKKAERLAAILRDRKSIRIQRILRGCLARRAFIRLLEDTRQHNRQQKGALKFQRLYRGHKGREAWEIERELMKFEIAAKPLFILVKQYTEELSRLASKISDLSSMMEQLKSEISESEIELFTVQRTTAHYSDSSRLNKTPQRFVTKYLRVRLKDYIVQHSELYTRKSNEFSKLQLKVNETNRLLRVTQRELVPLTAGCIINVKKNRGIRLRALVRRRDDSCIRIQSLWRGYVIRKGFKDPARDYWISCTDEQQSEQVYYYNTWTGETAWKMPFIFKFGISRSG